MRCKIAIVFAVILTALLVGCSPYGSENDVNPEKTYKIIVIEDCEYVMISRSPWMGNMALAHKGNCKNHKAN